MATALVMPIDFDPISDLRWLLISNSIDSSFGIVKILGVRKAVDCCSRERYLHTSSDCLKALYILTKDAKRLGTNSSPLSMPTFSEVL